MTLPKPRGGRPTLAQARVLDDRLLANARLVFARKGFGGATIDEIATSTGVSKHTVYRRYAGKQQLLDAVFEQDLLNFMAALTPTGANKATPLEALRAAALAYHQFGVGRGFGSLHLFLQAAAVHAPEMRNHLSRWSSVALSPLLTGIHRAQDAGLLRSDSAAEICSVLVDLLEGLNSRRRLTDDEADDRLAGLALFEQRWSVFIRAMATPSGSDGAA